MKRFVVAWRQAWIRLRGRNGPAAPDASGPTVGGRDEEIVEVLRSRHGKYGVAITRDAIGIYRLRGQRWAVEDWEITGGAFWFQSDIGTLTDTIENARILAKELLAAMGDSVEGGEPDQGTGDVEQ